MRWLPRVLLLTVVGVLAVPAAASALPFVSQHARATVKRSNGDVVIRESVRCSWNFNHRTMFNYRCAFSVWHDRDTTWRTVGGGGASSIEVDPKGIVSQGDSREDQWKNAYGRCVIVDVSGGGDRDGNGSAEASKHPC